MEFKDLVKTLDNIQLSEDSRIIEMNEENFQSDQDHHNQFNGESNESSNFDFKISTGIIKSSQFFMINLLNIERKWIPILAVIDPSSENSNVNKILLDTLVVDKFYSSNQAQIFISIGWLIGPLSINVVKDNEAPMMVLSLAGLKKFSITSHQYFKQTINQIFDESLIDSSNGVESDPNNDEESVSFISNGRLHINVEPYKRMKTENTLKNNVQKLIDKFIKFELLIENELPLISPYEILFEWKDCKQISSKYLCFNQNLEIYSDWKQALDEKIIPTDQPFEDLLIFEIIATTYDTNVKTKLNYLLVKFLPSDFYLILPIELKSLISKHFWKFVQQKKQTTFF